MKKTLLLTFAIFVALYGVSTLSIFAQERETITTQKSGRFHIGKAVRVGDKTLETGMYQVQHADKNGEHSL